MVYYVYSFIVFGFSCAAISVKTFTGETYSLQVKGSDTVASVKFKMRGILNIPHDEQALVYNEMVLEDMITLADVFVKKDSTLTLMRKSSGWVSLVINDHNGLRHCSMNVKLSDTIGSLKANIPSIDPQNEELVFNDMVLDDTCILANLPIMAHSILTLMGNSKIRARRMEILVKTLTGKTISFDVEPSTTIGRVKARINYLEHQRLIFKGVTLCEDIHRTIGECNIPNESTIDVYLTHGGRRWSSPVYVLT